MNRLLRLSWVALAAALAGCVVRVPGPGPRMGYNEAVDRGFGECRARGLVCELQEAHPAAGGDVWRVNLRIVGPELRGHLHLEYGAWNRQLLRADQRVHPGQVHGATPVPYDEEEREEHGR